MMKKKSAWIIGLISMLLVVGYACQNHPADSLSPDNNQSINVENIEGNSLAAKQNKRNYRTHLTGANEVPSVETKARGQAIFQVNKDGTSISYKLIVANIENVTMAHIHNAPAGQNGGVIVWLYPSSPPPQLIEGRFQGVLAEGTITADDLVGGLAGQTLDDLIEQINMGNTYVNVHTSQFPAGEVRGQIQ